MLVEPPLFEQFSSILRFLRGHCQESIFEYILRNLETMYLHKEPNTDLDDTLPKNATVDGVAALLKPLIDRHELLRIRLGEWIVTGLGGGIRSTSLRRAILAVFREDTGQSEICLNIVCLVTG